MLESKLRCLTLTVYFLTKGEVAFVLPECEDLPFLLVEEGDAFGIIDLVPEDREIVIEREVDRTFTMMAMANSELLCLSIEVKS